MRTRAITTHHTATSPRATRRLRRRAHASIALVALAALALSACASGTDGDDTSVSDAAADTVTLVVHDSFPNEEFAQAASAATGYDVRVITAGDGGELTNQLVLTRGAPIADAFFGVDNVFASRLIEYDVVEPFVPSALPERAAEYAFDEAGSLTPITLSATCINIDPAWFADAGLAPPESYEDLIDPAYADLTVLLDPTSSSTGASFLIGTVARFGEDGFAEYWEALAEGGARIEQGWSEAYNGRFTQGGGEGTFPIVLSYSSSPAWTITEDGTESTTRALLDTCSSQIEYAGVLRDAENPEGARALVEYLVSTEFQNTIADTMYVYPVDAAANVPESWETFAPMPTDANDLPAAQIGERREAWLRTWSDATGW